MSLRPCSVREQDAVSPCERGLPLHVRRDRGPRQHGRVCRQKGPPSRTECGKGTEQKQLKSIITINTLKDPILCSCRSYEKINHTSGNAAKLINDRNPDWQRLANRWISTKRTEANSLSSLNLGHSGCLRF